MPNRGAARQHFSYFQFRLFPSTIQAMALSIRPVRVSVRLASRIHST
jgi:hypothetical protein